MIGDKYNFLPETLNSVISVAHFWFGATALKFLFNKLGAIFPCSPLYDLYFFTLIRLLTLEISSVLK